MSTALIALAATAAALALTWFFCMRPMRRSGREGCCAPPVQSIDDQLKAARQELAQLQAGRPVNGPDTIPPHR